MVTLSSTEEEVYAAIECAKDIIFSRDLLVDNKSAIVLSQPLTGEHRKVRHFMARLRFLIEQVEKQVIKLEQLQGTNHPADVPSKSKPRPGHEQNTLDLLGPQRDGADLRTEQVQAALPTPQMPHVSMLPG